MREYWPPIGVAGGIGSLDPYHNQSRPGMPWARGLRVGLITKSVFFSPLLVSCGFHGILPSGGRSEYNSGLFPGQPPEMGGKSHVGETGKGSRVSSVGEVMGSAWIDGNSGPDPPILVSSGELEM